MNFAVTYSRAQQSIHAPLVTVEAHISPGLPQFSIVGLPETGIKESRDRVRSAIITSNFEFPYRRITINLGPADLPKEGARFDLATALAILSATQQIPPLSEDYEFIGELALSGEIRGVSGILSAAIAAKKAKKILIIPEQNAAEAALVQDLSFYSAKHLLQVCAHFKRERLLTLHPTSTITGDLNTYPDIQDVKGQASAKRALLIAAAGGHNLLMSGPPGTGKTMLASRLPGILPPLSQDEALEIATLQSLKGIDLKVDTFYQRPFRTPHHTSSAVSLVGGGSNPKPGEISLAHQGVLFMDELPEFDRKVLEVLREPIESGKINIARAQQQVTYPAEFQLIAAMNPCPCGYLGSRKKSCRCSAQQIQRYRAKLSGPFLDRIDLYIEVADLPDTLLISSAPNNEDSSERLRSLVIKARTLQLARQGKLNKNLSGKEIEQHCALSMEQQIWLQNAFNQLQLSARALHRLLKVARTIADLETSPGIEMLHLTEALNLRK